MTQNNGEIEKQEDENIKEQKRKIIFHSNNFLLKKSSKSPTVSNQITNNIKLIYSW